MEKLPIGVVIPTLNAADLIRPCLEAVQAQQPEEIVVVDGGSRDGTIASLRILGIPVVRHDGPGPASARQAGVEHLSAEWIALIDVDVVLPERALKTMLEEARAAGAEGIQARLSNQPSRGYWSRQLARHHNAAPSALWFGVSAALVRRKTLQAVPFDPSLASGEDVDIRRRLEQAGRRVMVSRNVTVEHRYGPGLETAAGQWLADGAGYGRLIRKFGWPLVPWAFLPIAAAGRGIIRSIPELFVPVPYYIGHALGNALGLVIGLLDVRVRMGPGAWLAAIAALVAMWLVITLGIAVPLALAIFVVTHLRELGDAAYEADWLAPATGLFVLLLAAREIRGDRLIRPRVFARHGTARPARMRATLDGLLVLVGLVLAVVGALRLAALLGLAR